MASCRTGMPQKNLYEKKIPKFLFKKFVSAEAFELNYPGKSIQKTYFTHLYFKSNWQHVLKLRLDFKKSVFYCFINTKSNFFTNQWYFNE